MIYLRSFSGASRGNSEVCDSAFGHLPKEQRRDLPAFQKPNRLWIESAGTETEGSSRNWYAGPYVIVYFRSPESWDF